jgi:hypothetical protein
MKHFNLMAQNIWEGQSKLKELKEKEIRVLMPRDLAVVLVEILIARLYSLEIYLGIRMKIHFLNSLNNAVS